MEKAKPIEAWLTVLAKDDRGRLTGLCPNPIYEYCTFAHTDQYKHTDTALSLTSVIQFSKCLLKTYWYIIDVIMYCIIVSMAFQSEPNVIRYNDVFFGWSL